MNAPTKPTGEPVRYVIPGQFARITTGPGLFNRPAPSTPSTPAPAPKLTFEEISKRGAIAAAYRKIRLAKIALKKALNA